MPLRAGEDQQPELQSSSLARSSENFSEEVDEYESDYSHRLSIVKRYNIPTNSIQPGSFMVYN